MKKVVLMGMVLAIIIFASGCNNKNSEETKLSLDGKAFIAKASELGYDVDGYSFNENSVVVSDKGDEHLKSRLTISADGLYLIFFEYDEKSAADTKFNFDVNSLKSKEKSATFNKEVSNTDKEQYKIDKGKNYIVFTSNVNDSYNYICLVDNTIIEVSALMSGHSLKQLEKFAQQFGY